MNKQINKSSEEFRHERKFLISGYAAAEVEQIIKYNPACFKEIYQRRTVNNIYFDSLGFDSYYGNVEGDTNRTKARIRWYGETFGPVKDAVLEFKIKKGLVGMKEFYPLSPFVLNGDFSKAEIIKAFGSDNLPRNIKDLMLSLQPCLLNSYSRVYFLSMDKDFRLTIDKDLLFYRISYNKNSFLNKLQNHNSVILELKYNKELDEKADTVTVHFPFQMTKNSKYQEGIEKILF